MKKVLIVVKKEDYDEKDLDLILQAHKWRKAGYIVSVKGSVACYGCENTMPLESSEVNPELKFFHEDDCNIQQKTIDENLQEKLRKEFTKSIYTLFLNENLDAESFKTQLGNMIVQFLKRGLEWNI